MIVFLIILIIFLIIGALLGRLAHRFVNAIGLMGLDKTLGSIFGLARGVLLVVIFVMVASFTPMMKTDNWKNSWLIPQFKAPAEELFTWLKGLGLIPEPSKQQQAPANMFQLNKAQPNKVQPNKAQQQNIEQQQQNNV